MLNMVGVLSYARLKKSRRVSIFLCFVSRPSRRHPVTRSRCLRSVCRYRAARARDPDRPRSRQAQGQEAEQQSHDLPRLVHRPVPDAPRPSPLRPLGSPPSRPRSPDGGATGSRRDRVAWMSCPPIESSGEVRRRPAARHLSRRELPGAVRLPARRLPARACRALEDGHGVLVAAPTGSGKTLVGEFAVHLALAEGRKCFYTTPDQGAVEPEVRRPGASLRPGEGRPADRRQHHQWRGTGRGHDDRGVAQHALRVVADADRPGLRRDGRGALPRRPDPRRGVGRGDHPPPRIGAPRIAVRHGQQRRGVRRLAGHGPRRDDGDRRGAPTRSAVAAHDGRPAHVRHVHRRRPRAEGQSRTGSGDRQRGAPSSRR